ncbi:GrpB family protein [Actinopolymorpha alba]|uniref:GrpB family protein n=1 Tax=Actinopolymorpha alba TaxID=533267 RepID=UPI0003789008|nr:GrpB family protein [Actinopolymorpha alba]
MSHVDEPIEVVPSQDDWLSHGQRLRAEVCALLGLASGTVEHIGSTAVPGLAAKPVIDLMVGCPESERSEVAHRLSEVAGYEYLREHSPPGREYLRRRTSPPWSNVHVVELNAVLWRDNLVFRDFLRADPSAALEYANAKRSAVEQTGCLRAYSAAKADTVQRVLERARSWAGTRP